MYIRRKIDDHLLHWKEDKDRLPLIVKGARQIGKTESILHFAYGSYANVVYINFALQPKYKTILSDGYEVDNILKNISLIAPEKAIVPHETIIIFDELQECPDIATSLKSFKLDGRYDVICSGSMLGLNYKNIHSNSVGYKMDYDMYSLDFEEFLWAKGYSEDVIEDMLGHMLDIRPFNETEMAVYRALFLDFCVLGGMPAVIKRYIETGFFTDTLAIQRQLMLDYEEDVRKYAVGLDQTKIINVFRSIPVQLAKENKKFQLSKVSHSARMREYQGCIDWLKDAGTVITCYCMAFPELPIKGNYDENKYKLYYPDTGLLVSCLDDEAQDDLRSNKNLGVYKGALYENFVAEAFMKQGMPLFYYRTEDSQLEADFFVRSKNELIPVEVKAGNNSAKSMQNLIRNSRYPDIKHGIKLCAGNVGVGNEIYTFPYFCCFLTKRYISLQAIFE